MATKREPSGMKLAPFALTVACLLAGCGSTTPTAPPPSPAASPAAQVDASAPASGVEASPAPARRLLQLWPPSRRPPRPTLKRFGRPPRPATWRPLVAPPPTPWRAAAPRGNSADNRAGAKAEGRRMAEAWGLSVAAMKQLEVPADTEADLRALIRRATVMQEFSLPNRPPTGGTRGGAFEEN